LLLILYMITCLSDYKIKLFNISFNLLPSIVIFFSLE
jgi:hypothetical protein